MSIIRAKISILLLCTAVMVSLSSSVQAAGNLYRYKNEEGTVVIEDRIPPQYVKDGYEVLNRKGRLVMTVPAKTVIPKSADNAVTAGQATDDNFLLRSFSRVKEIESARDRKLRMLDRELSILDKNMQDIERSQQQLKKQAANLQRSGQVPSDTLVDELSGLEVQRADAIKMHALRQQEREKINAQYDVYIERFRELSQGVGQ